MRHEGMAAFFGGVLTGLILLVIWAVLRILFN